MSAAGRNSIRQLIAVTTAVAAALVLASLVAAPPLGSTGLREASLPALVLVAALWFCLTRFTSRMALYTVVGSLFSSVFFLMWLGQTDIFYGHRHGPPPWLLVAATSAVVGVASGLFWFATSGVDAAGAPAVLGRRPLLPSIGMGALMAACVIVLLGASGGLTNYELKTNHYVEQRLFHPKMSVRQWADQLSQRHLTRRSEMASRMASHYLMPDDAAAIPVLAELLDDPNPAIRCNVARTLAKLVDDAWGSGRLTPDFPNAATRAALVRGLSDEDPVVRQELTQAMLHIDPAAVVGPRPPPGSLPFPRPRTP
jgi:hypothetical protein